MKEMDGRKLSHKTREEIRIRAVKRVEAGESPEDVIRALGFHRSCIYTWIAKYREGGVAALRTRAIPGRPRKLSGDDLKKIYETVTRKNPQQLKFQFALWTRGMVREWIRDELGVRLSETSVGRLLRKLGLSPQRPLHRAYQQDQAAVEHWKRTEFPEIRKLARAEGARIYFCDEASVRSDFHSGTTWAPRGKTPVVRSTGARFSTNMISAISPRGELRFMVVDGKLDASKFIGFLKRLIDKADHPVFLIVDRHPVHRSAKVRKFVESTDGALRLFFQPSYSPELNPDEHVWNHVKNHNIGKRTIAGPDHLRKMVISALRSLQKLPATVRGFFGDPHLSYVTA